MQTEDDESEKESEQESTKHSLETQNNRLDRSTEPDSETFETTNEDATLTDMSMEILKQKEFIEKLQKLSNLKRKSDEFVSKSYYSDLMNTGKRIKMREKYNKPNNFLLQSSNFEDVNRKDFYDEGPLDISSPLKQQINMNKEINDKCKEQTSNALELKTECDDMDIIVTDPAVCTTPKSFDGSRDLKRDLPMPVGYQSPQDSKYLRLSAASTLYLGVCASYFCKQLSTSAHILIVV